MRGEFAAAGLDGTEILELFLKAIGIAASKLDCPQYLPELLAKTAAVKESGGSKCTICKRNFIVPRVEWIEWWEIAKVLDHKTIAGMASAASPLRQKENERDVLESMVPLIRRGCSWLCAPAKRAVIEDLIEQPDEMDVDEP